MLGSATPRAALIAGPGAQRTIVFFSLKAADKLQKRAAMKRPSIRHRAALEAARA